MNTIPQTLYLDEKENALVILDQTLLPGTERYLSLRRPEEFWEAIYKLRVRGAPAIGDSAAAGMAVCAQTLPETDFPAFYQGILKIKDYFASSRPTAVNLFWALERMQRTVLKHKGKPVSRIKQYMLQEAQAIIDEDIACCRDIGKHGLSLLHEGDGVLTHCNAGSLATAGYGTATAPLYMALERGISLKIYADETRPLLQGARLTAYELLKAGMNVTLLCDNMAASLMQKGKIQAVFVGCDRVAANGDTANKIGTCGVAVLAKHFGIPFYVCAPFSTVDRDCPDGSHIVIEERSPEEVTKLWYQEPMAPEGISVYNPAFDVTPHELITAFVTERGIYEKIDQQL